MNKFTKLILTTAVFATSGFASEIVVEKGRTLKYFRNTSFNERAFVYNSGTIKIERIAGSISLDAGSEATIQTNGINLNRENYSKLVIEKTDAKVERIGNPIISDKIKSIESNLFELTSDDNSSEKTVYIGTADGPSSSQIQLQISEALVNKNSMALNVAFSDKDEKLIAYNLQIIRNVNFQTENTHW